METLLDRFIRALEAGDFSEIDKMTKQVSLRNELAKELKHAKDQAHAHSQVKMLAGAIQGWLKQ